jgi:hypothetical protein
MHSAEKKQVINAIGELGRRVTPADVATKTGLPFLVVQQELNKVASEANGHLQVGKTGDIVYSFTPGFSNAYLARGIKAAMLTFWASVFAALFYVVRISFGIALVLSLVIGFVLIIAISLAMMFGLRGGNDRDDGEGGMNLDWIFNGGGGGFHFTFWDWMILRDLLWWNTPRIRYAPQYNYNQPTVRDRARSSFLLNCFSFLFGDGDPNEGLAEKRWQVIAQVIKRNNNVVTAEQLSPYTGADPKNEDAVLPVLVRFNGRPEVTTKGNIVYVFEQMGTVAAEQHFEPPAYLQEFPWKFSTVPDKDMLAVYIVAGLNLAVVYTGLHMLYTTPFGGIPHLITLFHFLMGYAIAFIAIPMWRAVINAIRNKGIDARNIDRFRFSQIVQHPSDELLAKLAEARSFKVSERRISEKDIVFTTEKDARDQDDELTDKFKDLEAKKNPRPAAKPAPADEEEDGSRIINVAPPAEESNVINIKKHAEEFDASP